MRESRCARRRSLTGSGSDDAWMSKRRCTALETLLTFCPPAPWAGMGVHSISAGLMSIMGKRADYPPIRNWIIGPPTESVKISLFAVNPRKFLMRVFNFSAGPAVLPEPVLQQAAPEILDS